MKLVPYQKQYYICTTLIMWHQHFLNHFQTNVINFRTGGKHYSDRLCSDRRYSDNLQLGRPSTSLARLAYVEIVEIGNKLEWVEALDASKARQWSRHWGDWGERSLGRVSQWVWGPTLLQRSYSVLPTQLYCPWFSKIWFGVFPISTARRPIQLQSATRRPDCAWTVGIASVGTESVGIVWCTLNILIDFIGRWINSVAAISEL